MTDPSKVKTLGIRLPDELHTQFVLVASLDGLSLTDAIRRNHSALGWAPSLRRPDGRVI